MGLEHREHCAQARVRHDCRRACRADPVPCAATPASAPPAARSSAQPLDRARPCWRCASRKLLASPSTLHARLRSYRSAPGSTLTHASPPVARCTGGAVGGRWAGCRHRHRYGLHGLQARVRPDVEGAERLEVAAARTMGRAGARRCCWRAVVGSALALSRVACGRARCAIGVGCSILRQQESECSPTSSPTLSKHQPVLLLDQRVGRMGIGRRRLAVAAWQADVRRDFVGVGSGA